MDGSCHPCGRSTRPASGRQLARDKGAIHHPRAWMVPFPAGGCTSSRHKTEMRRGKGYHRTGPGLRTGISIPAPKRARSLVSRQAQNMTECVSLKKSGLEAQDMVNQMRKPNGSTMRVKRIFKEIVIIDCN